MPYIYKITNTTNGKVYIGKTLHTVEERWAEHRNDFLKDRCSKRPLYSAMRKYGIDNFEIEAIEECEDTVLSERERYWIEVYGSFKHGYNATMGGDGKQYLDYDLIVETYRNTKSQRKTAKILGISADSVYTALAARKEKKFLPGESFEKPVNMFAHNEEYLRTFPSLKSASQFLLDSGITNAQMATIRKHITEVCLQKRKNAYGFKWSLAS